MSEQDKRALEQNFTNWKTDRASNLSESAAFELYAVGEILKHHDLSDDEIEAGNIGGGDDGGIDGMYFFIDRSIMLPDSDVPDNAASAELVIIQAKYRKSFAESTIQKLESFTRDLLDWTKPVNALSYLNASVREAIQSFREKHDQVQGSINQIAVSFHYATKSTSDPDPKVSHRVKNLETCVNDAFTVQFDFTFWGAAKLLQSVRSQPEEKFVLPYAEAMFLDDGSVISLISLQSFVEFLKDDGRIRENILEPNVRDYQGRNNPVNREIRSTLEQPNNREFWWLNNGITILANECTNAGRKLTIDTPQVVNGLQTSQELFSYFGSSATSDDNRHVLVRVIVPTDERTRNDIIRATNNQTKVSSLSLHATDRIHFDIEDRLKQFQLFYDRRKGHYRRLKKPIRQIVSIGSLAQSVMAIVLQQPNEARARPQSYLKREGPDGHDNYSKVFTTNYATELYAACVLLDRAVSDYLRAEYEKEIVRDIRFYVDMWIACVLCSKAKPLHQDIAAIVQDVQSLEAETISKATEEVYKIFAELGHTDTVAKSAEYRDRLVAELELNYPNDV